MMNKIKYLFCLLCVGLIVIIAFPISLILLIWSMATVLHDEIREWFVKGVKDE